MSNLKRDIEEILEPKCLRSGCEVKHRCNPKTATQQIINLIEAVIGEDEVVVDLYGMDLASGKIEYAKQIRNQLRADIKSKLIGKG